MKKSILTGKVETIETVEAASISPKKGVRFFGKPPNTGGFSEFTNEESGKVGTPKTPKTPKSATSKTNKSDGSDKNHSSPLKVPKKNPLKK